ncbi:MAG: type II toxin-antitoxin system HicB family antitoxin [Prosthecobacter sp.]|nr:type II toxin-antitoxin system HicB family antitoxin [Prosthecobacter sp.]
MQLKYLLILEQAGGNYSAYFPDVPGCVTTGETVEETVRNAQEALAGHLEGETPPCARSLKAIADEGEILEDGLELIAWVPYEVQQYATA